MTASIYPAFVVQALRRRLRIRLDRRVVQNDFWKLRNKAFVSDSFFLEMCMTRCFVLVGWTNVASEMLSIKEPQRGAEVYAVLPCSKGWLSQVTMTRQTVEDLTDLKGYIDPEAEGSFRLCIDKRFFLRSKEEICSRFVTKILGTMFLNESLYQKGWLTLSNIAGTQVSMKYHMSAPARPEADPSARTSLSMHA